MREKNGIMSGAAARTGNFMIVANNNDKNIRNVWM